MSLTKVTLAGLERFVQPHDLDNYLLHGWQVVNEQQKDLFEQPAQVVDSGAIATKAPKRKSLKRQRRQHQKPLKKIWVMLLTQENNNGSFNRK